MTLTPCRALLAAAADAAHLPHALLTDAALLHLLLEADVYPHCYRLPADAPPAPPGWTVAVVCAECSAAGELSPTRTVWVDPAWADHASGAAVVRCPTCACLLRLPLRGLSWWRWRWYHEALQAWTVCSGLGRGNSSPPGYWQPGLWGEPPPTRRPQEPPALPTTVLEPAMPVRLHQPIRYHLHTTQVGTLLGYLLDAAPADDDTPVAISVDLPTDATDRAACIQEMLRLSGRAGEDVTPYLGRSALRLEAMRGMATGRWWPRAEEAIAEEPTSSPSEIPARRVPLEITPTEGEE